MVCIPFGLIFLRVPQWVYDRTTLKFLTLNNAATRHYEYTGEDFIQMNILDMRPRKDIRKILELTR
jgi:hypothetical protein